MIEKIEHYMTQKRVVGILVTLLSIVVNDAVLRFFGWSSSVALIISVPVFVAYYSGLRAGLTSCILITFYRYLWLAPGVLSTAIMGTVNMFLSTLAVGVLYRRAKAIDELLNGNTKKLEDAFGLTKQLLHHWDWYTDVGKKEILRQVEDRIGNLITIIFGYAALRKEIKEVSTFYKGEEK